MTSIDRAEADLHGLAEQTVLLQRHIAMERANAEFKITRFEIVVGVLVVLGSIAWSYFHPWGVLG